MLQPRDMKLNEGVYTFVTKSGANINVASTRLYNWCENNQASLARQITMLPVDLSMAKSFLKDNIASLARVQELRSRPTLSPVILCRSTGSDEIPDAMLVDGHHRYVLYALLGRKFILSYLLEPQQWHPFIVEGLSDLTQAQLSAIPITQRSY